MKEKYNHWIKAIQLYLELHQLNMRDLFAGLCTAYCITCISIPQYETNFIDVNFVNSYINIFYFMIFLIVCFLIEIYIRIYVAKDNRMIKVLLVLSSTGYGMKLCKEYTDNVLFYLGIALILFLVVSYVYSDSYFWYKKDINLKWMWGIILALALFIFGYITYASIARYKTYSNSCFDFGIFAQMFEKIRTTKLPITTVERNEVMSHFGVHFSPTLYLLMPIYVLFPRPETILVLQAFFIVLGVIPVALICRHFKFTNKITIAISFIYLLYPTLANAALTDFHENKLLSVSILFLLYFMLKEKKIGYFISMIITLGIKEDAAIYIFAISIYMFFIEKKRVLGVTSFIISGIYFCIASKIIKTLGNGIMISRLNNYIPSGEEGFLPVMKTCFFNIGYLISQVFTIEKILFVLVLLLPLGFAPFMVKKKTSLILMVPMLVINLMPNWIYQYNIDYQYTYGVVALLVFLLIIVLSEKLQTQKVNARKLVLFSLMMTSVLFCAIFTTRAKKYTKKLDDKELMNEIKGYNELISKIPKDESITANTFYIPHMYDFEDLYMYPNYYHTSKYTKYLLVNSLDVGENKDKLADFIGDHYKEIDSSGKMVLYELVE